MAGIRFHINSGEVALINGTKTVLGIIAPANQRIIIKSLRITGKQAAGGTDAPILLKFQRSSNTGTGTTATPVKFDPTDDEILQSTGKGNFTIEPTGAVDSGLWWEVQLQGGVEEFLPPGQELIIPGGQMGYFTGVATTTPTILITATCEE